MLIKHNAEIELFVIRILSLLLERSEKVLGAVRPERRPLDEIVKFY